MTFERPDHMTIAGFDLETRWHQSDTAVSSAIYSPCERYRYALTRTWNPNAPRLAYIMLNPSKATETANDPTIERCERRARSLGYGSFCAANLFAWRETDPAVLRKAPYPIGPANDAALLVVSNWATTVLAAWGVHGTLHDRAAEVSPKLRAAGSGLFHLGLTKEGHPRHPLYVSYATQPARWEPHEN